MDICLITIDNNLNKSLQPKTAIGMLWLQTHFENEQWEALSNSTVIISEENSQLLIETPRMQALMLNVFLIFQCWMFSQKTIKIGMFNL